MFVDSVLSCGGSHTVEHGRKYDGDTACVADEYDLYLTFLKGQSNIARVRNEDTFALRGCEVKDGLV